MSFNWAGGFRGLRAMAPIMVALMLAIHHCAPDRAKPFTQAALGWMMIAAALTTVVHFVELTVARHFDATTVPGYARIFGFAWPSTLYAIDIVAWDVFFGLALLSQCRLSRIGVMRRSFGVA